jgi:hypothetical protein
MEFSYRARQNPLTTFEFGKSGASLDVILIVVNLKSDGSGLAIAGRGAVWPQYGRFAGVQSATGAYAAGHDPDGRRTKRQGKSVQIQQCHVPLASLDAPDVGSVHVGFFGKLLLGPAVCQARLADALAESKQECLFFLAVCHAR